MENKNSYILSFLMLTIEGIIISFVFFYLAFGDFSIRVFPLMTIIIILTSFIATTIDIFKNKRILKKIYFNKLNKIVIIDNIFYKKVKVEEVTGRKYILGNYLSATFVREFVEGVEERIVVKKKNYFKLISLVFLMVSLLFVSNYFDKTFQEFESKEIIYAENDGQIIETNKFTFVIPSNYTYSYSTDGFVDKERDIQIVTKSFDNYISTLIREKDRVEAIPVLGIIYDNSFGLLSKILREIIQDKNTDNFFHGKDFYAFVTIKESYTMIIISDKDFKEEVQISTNKLLSDRNLVKEIIESIKKR